MTVKQSWLLSLIALLCGAVLVGCPAADDDDDASGEFEAGMFEFSTVGVTDGCIGGAAEALYMPDGPSVPVVWEDAIELPAFSELPKTYTIPLPDPFHDMEITIDSPGEDQFVMEGAENNDVYLDEDQYGDCLTDNDISAVLTLQDNDTITGTSTLSVTNVRGDNCPQFDADPCEVVLDIEAARL